MINKYFKHFSFFYHYLKYRIFVNMGLNISVGLMDGFGIVMFLPLLRMTDNSTSENEVDLGGFDFIIKVIEGVGLSLNLKTVLLIMLSFFILKGLARFVEAYYRTIMQNFLVKSIRIESLGALSKFKYKSFVKSDSGRIQNTLSEEVSKVVGASSAYFMAIQSGIMVLVYSTLAFLANPQFALMVIFGGFTSNAIFNFINKKTILASRKITKDSHDYQGLLIQKVAYFKYLKATGLINVYQKKLEEIVESINDTNKKMGLYSAVLYAIKEPLVMSIVVIVILIQTLILSQNLSLIILSLLFFYRGLTFLMSFQSFYNSFLNNSGSMENMKEFLIELHIHREENSTQDHQLLKKGIELENVSFSYGKKPIINNVSLNIKKNESIAFVGGSGSGKTTLVNLIAGLMPIDSGKIKVDGFPMDQLCISSYRKRIGYITQEPVVFSDSVFNNVTFWADPTEENKIKFWNALEKARIIDFIKDLPDQENSMLGTNGILISGGQKQRISIARELYKDIDILIMDEATSSLDSEIENDIKNNIDILKGHLTIIIIAHRLSTIKNVDKIYLLDSGNIIYKGGFFELFNLSDEFKRMVELQEFY